MKLNNDTPAEFPATGELRLTRLLPGPIERIWEYLVDPEKRGRWFAGGPMELKASGKMTLVFRHKNIAPDEIPPEDHKQYHDPGESMEGTVLRCEPPRLLSYTFGDDSDVTFELTPQGKQVLLILTHRSRGTDLPYLKGFASGWHTHLMQLIALLEGAPRPPFWPNHARLKADYVRRLGA
ncbi:MAG TPA: SRPBCC family protein [Candidatus Didemnitutus sp.]|nr:SRPBCC family protein [Candidatus Didemnitutus sp.]